MKKYLITKEGTFYKANLHCHSTVSDGKLTPEELKKIYKENGYSVLAYTDHNVLVAHSELADSEFLPLNGYEIDISEPHIPGSGYGKTSHICLVALEPDNLKQICYHREKYLKSNAVNYRDVVQYDENEPDFERVYNHECISEVMKRGRENGFFVTYNHPAWSMEDYTDYVGFNGMHAMEICNYGCYEAGYTDYNEKEYDDLLRAGKRIYCIGADDNHNIKNDSFGAYTMIKAEKLDYKTITDALLNGNFYASQAPEIHDLWFEDGKICITCSDVKRIALNTGRRRAECIYTTEKDKFLNYAEFNVMHEDGYVRITVTDSEGKHANTNAYFTDELFNEND